MHMFGVFELMVSMAMNLYISSSWTWKISNALADLKLLFCGNYFGLRRMWINKEIADINDERT